jgi:KaiC/GvpD/RAD55 family RecA-like ATPase
MDETKILAAMYHDRQAHETALRIGVDAHDFGETARCVFISIGEQYTRDSELPSVDYDTLRTQVERRFGKGHMADSVMEFVGRFPENVSSINILEEYRLLRLGRCSTELATLLATGQHGDETQQTLAVYNSLVEGQQEEAGQDRLTFEDFVDDDAARLPLSPSSLDEYIGGGVLRGHNVTIYGRPEAGKTLLALNIACSAIRCGHKVLYVANEEPAREVTKRVLSRLRNVDVENFRDKDELALAFKKAAKFYKNWNILHKANLSARDVGRACARLRPDYVIVDQLKNLRCADENRALQLDKVARQVREIGIEYDCVTVSVTQAGDSAEQKLVLSMNDIEWSNTGIPGAADLLLGIGVNDQIQGTGKRILSICKNKVNGRHGNFPVYIDARKTKVTSQVKA